MRIFISGTDTNIGKTVISSWLALHSGFDYFKPIQTGARKISDSETVANLSKAYIHPEIFSYQEPLSPHLAAKIENERIDIENIILPQSKNLIIEGAGGVLVPINEQYLMVDLIKKLDLPVILVSHSRLGTINHSLLTIEALKSRNIKLLGVIMNGERNIENMKAIEFYGRTKILAEFPKLHEVSHNNLLKLSLTDQLKSILRVS